MLSPTACPATGICCPPFPLPRDLEVGDRWTTLLWPSIETTDTLITTVIARHEVDGQTYFELSGIAQYTRDLELSDRGLYRVDDEGKTWKYDAETESEVLYWDMWVDQEPFPEELTGQDDYETRDAQETWVNDNGYAFFTVESLTEDLVFFLEYGWHAKQVVVNGWMVPHPFDVLRHGPYGLEELESISRDFLGAWKEKLGQTGNTWRELLIDWGVTEVYGFYYYPHSFVIISPEIGTLYHAGYVKRRLYNEYIVLKYERGVIATSVEDISLGRLKDMLGDPEIKK